MASTRHPDLLILGGGCAGLSLARELAAAGSGLDVVIVEPRERYTDDRTWCFWEHDRHHLDHLVSQRWHRWRCSRANRTVIERSAPGISYQLVRALDFYQDALAVIDGSSIELARGRRVEAIRRAGQAWQVETDQGPMRAARVVDTRPPAREHLAGAAIFQCFSGQILRLCGGQRPDPGAVGLMVDLRNDPHGLLFHYVLPLGEDRVLAEATRFAPVPIGPQVLADDLAGLRRQRGWTGAAVEKDEHAILPMGLPLLNHAPSPGLVRAGTGAGALRPASGYGFLRIQAWARACATRLASGQAPIGHPLGPLRQRLMDRLFLDVLRGRPELGPMLFERLFERTDPGALVRFLSDRASPTDCLRVVTSLPRMPFLRQLLTPSRRRSSGLA